MKPTSLTPPSPSPDARVPAAQFLFSGRGPLRRAQIEWLRERSNLDLPTAPLADWREAWLRS
jgi:hypothetical protein